MSYAEDEEHLMSEHQLKMTLGPNVDITLSRWAQKGGHQNRHCLLLVGGLQCKTPMKLLLDIHSLQQKSHLAQTSLPKPLPHDAA